MKDKLTATIFTTSPGVHPSSFFYRVLTFSLNHTTFGRHKYFPFEGSEAVRNVYLNGSVGTPVE